MRFIKQMNMEEFDRFVAKQASGSFLQSTTWGKWMEQNEQTSYQVGVVNDSEKIILVAQIFISPIPKLGGKYAYIPYGPIVDEQVSEKEYNKILDFFYSQFQQQFSNVWFLRIEPKQVLPSKGKITKHIQPGKTLIMDLTETEEKLLADMHHKTRYNIRVATRHEVIIKTEFQPEILKLIENTAGRHGYKSHGLNYYQKLINFFQNPTPNLATKISVTTYSAWLGKELLAGAVMIDFGTTRTYLFGGTSDLQKNVMAPYLLHWQAILDAKKAGMTIYDFWGIETASGLTPGFVRFKLGWGGTTVQYPMATDIIYKPIHYGLYKILRQLNKILAQ